MNKVLLIEDNLLLNDGIGLLINKWEGYNCDSTSSAEDGLRKLRNVEYDIVLLDIKLPGMSGLELLELIATESIETKVIMLTTHKNEEMIYAAVKFGAMGFITKEVSMDSLKEAIDTVLGGEKYFQKEIKSILIDYYASEDFGKTKNTLNEKQIKVLELMSQGLNSKEIGDVIFLSPRTIDSIRAEMIKLMGIKNSNELISKALREGIIS